MEAADAGFSRTTAVIFDRDDVNRVATPIRAAEGALPGDLAHTLRYANGRYPEVGPSRRPWL